MHADDGVLEAETHLGDGQRRGVGRENGALLAHLVELAEQLALGAHLFLDALDDEVGVRRGRLLLDEDVVQDGVLSLFGHLALLDTLLQGSGELILVALSGSDAGSVHQSGVALGREDLSDAAAHGAGAENCNFHCVYPPTI